MILIKKRRNAKISDTLQEIWSEIKFKKLRLHSVTMSSLDVPEAIFWVELEFVVVFDLSQFVEASSEVQCFVFFSECAKKNQTIVFETTLRIGKIPWSKSMKKSSKKDFRVCNQNLNRSQQKMVKRQKKIEKNWNEFEKIYYFICIWW